MVLKVPHGNRYDFIRDAIEEKLQKTPQTGESSGPRKKDRQDGQSPRPGKKGVQDGQGTLGNQEVSSRP